MLIYTLIFLVIVAGILIAIIAKQPTDFCITRSTLISAPASAVFAEVIDLHHWEAWSPWAKLDPDAKNSFEGPPYGTGAIMRWDGNNKVGTGSMAIIDNSPDKFIRFKLEFLKPFKATNTAEFSFKSDNHQTTVTWSMSGTNNFIGKAMGLIINCEKMVGGQFQQGLAALKSVVETQSPSSP
jgi:hypothetical protein